MLLAAFPGREYGRVDGRRNAPEERRVASRRQHVRTRDPDITRLRRPMPPGASAEEVCMFEERSAGEVDSLLKSNPEFKQLYQQHQDLDRRVMNAELGISPVDDLELTRLKREKLAAKDRLVRLADTMIH
jgi:uncharacterized protein YdcH (DUF465 family)